MQAEAPTLDDTLFSLAVAGEPVPDPIAERVLDGALEQFCETGLTRSTMEDVARRAGLSRVTVYRRFDNKNSLIEAVLLRECRRCINGLEAAVAGISHIEQRIVEGFVFALHFIREHPLVGNLLRLEPQVILPFMTVHADIPTAVFRTFMALHLRRAKDAGELADTDVDPIAELMTRIAASFLTSPSSCIPMTSDQDLRDFALRYLVRLIRPRPAP